MSGEDAGGWYLQWRQAAGEKRLPIGGGPNGIAGLTIGRSPECDVVLDDPYVSRLHCTVRIDGGSVVLDAGQARNPLRVDGRETAFFLVTRSPQAFEVGKTAFQVISIAPTLSETTLVLTRTTHLGLRGSTRELFERPGGVVAQFSASEYAAFAAIVRKYPGAANHREVGQAVWGDVGYDQYQIHRLMQRIRQRIGTYAEFLENVRGEGYRFHLPVEEA
jgi:hypothetical protein